MASPADSWPVRRGCWWLLAGGPDRLRESLRVPPTAVTGAGLLVAFLAAVAPLLVGEPLLASTVVKLHPPLLGEVKLVSTVVFDLGVAMVVVGVIVSILTYLGAGERDDTGLEHEGRP
ncbi:MAG: MnhB domain-containing protein [Ilumatobacteraceae bacterium]